MAQGIHALLGRGARIKITQAQVDAWLLVLDELDAINNRLDRLEKQATDQLREDLRVLKSEVNSLKAAEGEE